MKTDIAPNSAAGTTSGNLPHIRHSLAHLLGAAVLELYPGTKNTIGPAVDNGFYYDFDFSLARSADPRMAENAATYGVAITISDRDLVAVEKKMRSILKDWKTFEHKEVSVAEAKKIYADNPYKLELIDEIAARSEKEGGTGERITLYTAGAGSKHAFTDLCRGGHCEHPDKDLALAGWRLSHTAGAYWRGDAKNTMLTRIYGLAFDNTAALDAYETMLAEAEKRDHRKLGRELDIFEFDDDVGPGLPLWLPNGTVIVEELEKLAKEVEFKGGYERVRTPHIAKESMYLKSGHLPYYEESMFPPMEYEGGKYYLKAMNCPHHHKVFAARPKSYRDLPLRLAEYGTVYRHEKSGELFGLMRVRCLDMNDAHIYCTEEQFADEFRAVNEMYLHYFKIFGIDKYVMRFSTHDPKRLEGADAKYVNEPELWKKTEDMVRRVLIESNIPYVEVANEAAFYGPKIDVQVWSAIGREFTLATNQVDFAVPKRFDLVYTDSDGAQKTPLCIHRAPLGTHERFIGFLIEHYGGNFPVWLAPTQAVIIPVGAGENADNHHKEAVLIHEHLRSLGIRAKLDLSNASFGKKIRQAKNARAPYFIIIGDKDIEAGKITLESRDHGQIGQITKNEFFDRITRDIASKK